MVVTLTYDVVSSAAFKSRWTDS